MISDESKRKLRELQLDSMVDALDDQDSNPDTFLGMSFDDRMNLLIDSDQENSGWNSFDFVVNKSPASASSS